jgi:cation diffusion facilitator CzcD-associated flavoprotein CzcO
MTEHVGVAIIGSGFAGLAAAVGVLREGRRDLVVLERAQEVGGTWRDNHYPGAACDVPSRLYSLSFAPNPDWTRAFSPQAEIQAYLRRVADDHGVTPYVRFGAEVLAARWDEEAQHWELETTQGALTADAVVAGSGGLSTPRPPDVPGLDSFAGAMWHSAEWDHAHDLTGERVGVIGTGASAIQFVPEVRKAAAHTTVFQRTAPWVLPRTDRAISPLERALYRRLPFLMQLPRLGIYAMHEVYLLAYARSRRLRELGEREGRRHIARAISDPELRRKVTPTFQIGCKRSLLSNDWYPALAQPDVTLETDRIVEVLPHGVVTESAEGARTVHEVDTIILGTGFSITDQPIARVVTGRGGRTIAERWAETGMQALDATTVDGFPNFFFLVGPHSGQGHTSAVFMIEQQVGYVLQALRLLQQPHVAALEPKRQAVERFAAEVDRAMRGTVWDVGGCSSWYQDAAGRVTTLWPRFSFLFKKKLATFPVADYDLEAPKRAAVAA